MTRYARRVSLLMAAAMLESMASIPLVAHSGPPFPILSNVHAGAYEISVWTDPDATDDGSAGGQFWVVVQPADKSAALPPETRAHVAIRPLDRPGSELKGQAAPVAREMSRHFVALVMDHEGRYRVRASIEGPLGSAAVEAEVDATYDLRPAPFMMAIYLIPFLLVGFLWLKLLIRRRQA